MAMQVELCDCLATAFTSAALYIGQVAKSTDVSM